MRRMANHITLGRRVWALIQRERNAVSWLRGYQFVRLYRRDEYRVSRAMYQFLKDRNG